MLALKHRCCRRYTLEARLNSEDAAQPLRDWVARSYPAAHFTQQGPRQLVFQIPQAGEMMLQSVLAYQEVYGTVYSQACQPHEHYGCVYVTLIGMRQRAEGSCSDADVHWCGQMRANEATLHACRL